MKYKTLFRIFSVISLFITLNVTNSYSQNSSLNVLISNVCQFYGQFIFSNGNDSLILSSSIGSGGCIYGSVYTHQDSVSVLSKIKHVEFDPSPAANNSLKLFYMSDDEKIISKYTTFPISTCDPEITAGDTLVTDSINEIKITMNKLVVIRNTNQIGNFIVYDTTNFDTLSILNLNMIPKFMDVSGGFAAVAGFNSNNDFILNVVELSTGLIVEFGTYDSLAQNPISLKYGFQKVYLLSQPGDSAVYLSTYNFNSNAITYSSLYSSSGVHTFTWEGSFLNFQPDSDLSGNNKHLSVIKFDTFTMQQNAIFSINKRLHQLSFAGQDGYYPYIHAVEESTENNKVYIYASMNYSIEDSFITSSQVDFIKSDLRCYVGLDEYDDNLVKIVIYPNPADQKITIKASGLICGRDYKMDIVDIAGKTWHQQIIHSKMNLEIPIDNFPPGVYFFRNYTRKGLVTEKIVKT